MYGLIDCDSFYASCEQVFRPDLRHRPVIVLSGNDGCVIALTREAKALGIKRGIPYFKIKKEIECHHIAVFSSNFTLYGDLSSRVVRMIMNRADEVEVYSIDEAFINLIGEKDPISFCSRLRREIWQGVNIPVSIGIAPTRTLAKIATDFAKHYKGYEGVCLIDTDEKREKALRLIAIDEVWGIGRQRSKKMALYGIKTAWDFTQKKASWTRKNFKIQGLRTWNELQGISCLDAYSPAEKQSICTSRTFSHPIADVELLAERVAVFVAACAKKLRFQNGVSDTLTVFIYTSRHQQDQPQHQEAFPVHLETATNDTLELTHMALQVLRHIYRKGYLYKKAGVIVSNITSSNTVQQNLFDKINRPQRLKLNQAIDRINEKLGQNTIRLARQGNGEWGSKSELSSPHYTTQLDEIMRIK